MEPTYMLLHGAWHGGWCWQEVQRELEATGARVLAPTLPGLAERAEELTPAVGLRSHLAEAHSWLEALPDQGVVLCAHSYAGMIARGLADRAPHRLTAILYLDAYLPAPGQCGLDLRGEASNRALRASLQDGWRVPPPPAANFDVSPQRHADIASRLTDMSLACFEQSLEFSNLSLENPPASYVRTAWPNAGLDQAAEAFAHAGRPVQRWSCGHDAMLEEPARVSQLLRELAARHGAKPTSSPHADGQPV